MRLVAASAAIATTAAVVAALAMLQPSKDRS
jgi:hypothetical protein